jgi:8-oxo-dGTP pyrophosphatase MutT (NUDIX family)
MSDDPSLTTSRIAYIDVYVLRGRADALEVLLLRRARDQVRGGTWEGVHGKIDDGETPVAAARRELQEEIGCAPMVLYNLSRVEQFYLHASDAVVRLSAEHDTLLWLTPAGARDQCAWPRAARAIDDAVRLLGGGNAGLLEDVLRVG